MRTRGIHMHRLLILLLRCAWLSVGTGALGTCALVMCTVRHGSHLYESFNFYELPTGLFRYTKNHWLETLTLENLENLFGWRSG